MEDYPSGRVEKTHAVKVDISPKLDVEDLDARGNVSEPDNEHNIKEDAEADVSAVKFTCSNEALKT